MPSLYRQPTEADPRLLPFVQSIKPGNYFSQFGEDGILEAVFNRIGATNRWCVECGAGDGLFFSNTRRLIDQGWNSVQIEADEKMFAKLKNRYANNPNVIELYHAISLSPGSRIDDVLRTQVPQLPEDFDFLSLDVDGQEYHIVNGMVEYQPRVLLVEYNPNAEPMYIPEPGAPFLDQADLMAMHFVTEARGYMAICRTRVNLLCVRQDLAELLMEE